MTEEMVMTLLCDTHQKGMKFNYRESQSEPLEEKISINYAYDHYKCPLGCAITIVHRKSKIPIDKWKTKIKKL